jgi:AAA family ATP:ADP antiporter
MDLPERPARWHKLLSRVADIRPGETATATRLLLLFFFITFAAYIIKPVKEAALISAFNVGQLPYAYLLTAVVIGFVVHLNSHLLERLERRRYMSATFLFFCACLLVFWLCFFGYIKVSAKALALAYWVWSDIFIAAAVSQFWIAVNDACHPHQAKRLVGLFVSGGLLGGIAGSLLATGLAEQIGSEHLLLVSAGLLLLPLVIVNLIYQERVPRAGAGALSSAAVGYLESFRLVRGSRYLRHIATLVAVAVSVGTMVQFLFTWAVKDAIILTDKRTAFLAGFNLVLLAVSWILQLFLTARVLRWFGLRPVLMTAPVWIGLAALAVLLWPVGAVLVWACLLRGSDKVFDNSLNQSARELLYMPLAAEVKYKAKVFIDIFVNKFASGLAAIVLLVGFSAVSEPRVVISLATAALAGLWVVLARAIFIEYVGQVRHDLTRKWEDGHKLVAAHVDVDGARLLLDTIQSRDCSRTLYALNVLDLIQQDKLTPEMRDLLVWKDQELRARSMDALLDAGGESMFQSLEDTLSDEAFATEVREILSLDSYRKVIDEHIGRVVAAEKQNDVDRMEAAKMLGMMEATPQVVRRLKQLLQDPSPEVLNYALASAAVHRKKEFLPLLIGHLGNASTRAIAQDALVLYGSRVVGPLQQRLKDDRLAGDVRQAIPEILFRVGTQKAADVLVGLLDGGRGKARPETIDALFKLRSGNPEITFPAGQVRRAILCLFGEAYAVLLENGKQAARPRLTILLRQIFDLLSLTLPHEDIVRAYQNISLGTKKAVDYSLELLDNLLDPHLKAFIFPLIEDLPEDQCLAQVRRLDKILKKVLS